MITSVFSPVGANTSSLRPDGQAQQRVSDGSEKRALPPPKAEAVSSGGDVRAGDSGLGTEALRRLIASGESSDTDADGLTEAEQEVVEKLRARDVEVRRHEEAHARVGGQYAGQPSYSYQTGPDGKRYAIGGEVPIDVAPVPDDPEATIEKMRVVKAAALAPAEPSGADRRIAALADAQRLQAQADLSTQKREEALDGYAGQGPSDTAGVAGVAPSSERALLDGRRDRLLDGVRAVSADRVSDALSRAA